MSKLKVTCLSVFILGSVTPGHAQYYKQFPSEGWDLTPFQSETVEMALATNKKTGYKMHVMRLKDGSVMAIVPAGPISELMDLREKALR